MTANQRPPLKVGLLLNSLTVPAWVARMLDRIDGSEYAEVSLLIIRKEPTTTPVPAPSIGARIQSKLMRLYEAVDSKPKNSAFTPSSLTERYPDVPQIQTRVKTTRWVDRLPDEDVAAIEAHELDVLVRIGFRILRGGILGAARYGVWSFHHGDNRYNRGGPPGMWEVFDGEPLTGAVLQVLTEQLDDGTLLDRTLSATHSTSVAMNREALYWKALSMIPRQLEFLHEHGAEALYARAESRFGDPSFYDRPLYTLQSLTTSRLLGYLFRNAFRRVRNVVHYVLYHEQWHLRYAFKDEPASAFWRFQTLRSGRDRYWADPHPIEVDGRWHVFFEDYRYDKSQAHVSVISFDENGAPGESRDALVRPYHLSYPFVFEWDNRLWMVPETASERSVELYECTGFPDRWELRKKLLDDIKLVDATLFHHDNVWYLFGNVVENPGASSWDELFIFVNDGNLLDGHWTPHPANPIRSDVTCARPAGPLFTSGDRLYRPAQDSRHRYGGALAIHEVEQLSPTEYRERLVDRIAPDWDPDLEGTHTFAHRPGLTVIDVVTDIARSDLWARMPAGLHRRLRVRRPR